MFHASHIPNTYFVLVSPLFKTKQGKLVPTLAIINIENLANSKTIKFRYFKVHKWPIHLYVEIVQFFNNLREGQRIEQFETLSISDSSHVFYVTPIDVE